MRLQRLVLICVFYVGFAAAFNNASAQVANIDTGNLNRLILAWNDANSLKDTLSMSVLYSDVVLYYGKRLSQSKCIQNKLSLFKKHSDYNQQISGVVLFRSVNDKEIKCSFTKRVTYNQQPKIIHLILSFPCNSMNGK